MSRRILEKEKKKAAKLQAQVDDLVKQRGQLMESASKAQEFKAKGDCWRAAQRIEEKIERLLRQIRRLQTPQSLPNQQPSLWDFAPAADAKAQGKKGVK
jgi:hypothetical protein